MADESENGQPDADRRFIRPWKMFICNLVPDWLSVREDVSQGAKLTYARLCRYAGPKSTSAYPSQAELAKEVGVKRRHVQSYLKELCKLGLLWREEGRFEGNRYFFLLHPWMGIGGPSTLPADHAHETAHDHAQLDAHDVRGEVRMTGARNCAWDAHKTAHVPNKEELRIKEENQGDAPPSLARGGSVARKAADAPRGPRGVAERRAAAVAEAEAKASAESKLQTAAAEELRLARQRIEGMAPAERGELRAAALAGASEWERNRIGDKDHTRSPSLLTLMAAELKRHEQPQAKE